MVFGSRVSPKEVTEIDEIFPDLINIPVITFIKEYN